MSQYSDLATVCHVIMCSMVRKSGKIERRQALLEDNPSLQIEVDFEKLNNLVDGKIDMFLCNPRCSVARGEAIKGSDIDSGLIVTNEPLSEADQNIILSGLRVQGFSIHQEYEDGVLFATHDDILKQKEKLGIGSNEEPIGFMPHGVEGLFNNYTDIKLTAYYGGYKIGGEGQIQGNEIVESPEEIKRVMQNHFSGKSCEEIKVKWDLPYNPDICPLSSSILFSPHCAGRLTEDEMFR